MKKRLVILHIIQRLSRGGAGRALLNLGKYFAGSDTFQHRILSLLPMEIEVRQLAERVGFTFAEPADRNGIFAEIENAEIVQLHFWNSAELYSLLDSELPALRLLLSIHVAGDSPPHILTRQLAEASDYVLASGPYTCELPIFQTVKQKAGMIQYVADFSRLENFGALPHLGFRVGYIGTIDFVKMHPDYVAMHTMIDIPDVRFIMCGSGRSAAVVRRQTRERGVQSLFEFPGYVEDIASLLRSLDVFGYPLCRNNYSSTELVLQEAMFAGVPPVILPFGGSQRTVIHNETGLIAENEYEYPRAIEFLYRNPEARKKLGDNAKEFARSTWNAERASLQFEDVYRAMLHSPKSKHQASSAVNSSSGSQRFLRSLGGTCAEFEISKNSLNSEELAEADRQIANSSPALMSPDAGGVLHYRNYYPRDRYLRFWSGLMLLGHGYRVLSIPEFKKAIELGFDRSRIAPYLDAAFQNLRSA